jgi:hypothetical protein
MQPTPLKERNRHNLQTHCRQQPITQAGVAERLQCIPGKVRRPVELECDAPVHDRKIDAKQPVCCEALKLMWYAESPQRLSDLSMTVRHRHIPRLFPVGLHSYLKH